MGLFLWETGKPEGECCNPCRDYAFIVTENFVYSVKGICSFCYQFRFGRLCYTAVREIPYGTAATQKNPLRAATLRGFVMPVCLNAFWPFVLYLFFLTFESCYLRRRNHPDKAKQRLLFKKNICDTLFFFLPFHISVSLFWHRYPAPPDIPCRLHDAKIPSPVIFRVTFAPPVSFYIQECM